MADYIPFAVEAEILIRLPTRSLMRFRSVSKTWKALIDSSKFIADYTIQQTHQHHLLLKYYDPIKNQQKFYSVVDDDTFPQQKFLLNIYPIRRGFTLPMVLGVSQGVFCLDVRKTDYVDPQTHSIVLWNPCIRKSITIAVPKVLGYGYGNAIGFGVCPHTNDPMLVNINYHETTRQPWQVEVYRLSSRVWRSTPPINGPRNITFMRYVYVAIDEFIYWLAINREIVNSNYMYNKLIISFDMSNDEITDVPLPDSLARGACGNLALSKLKGSLVVLETIDKARKLVFNVWMMKCGVPNIFTKLFSLNAPDASIKTLYEFRKNNEPIFGVITDSDDDFFQELNLEQINGVGISGIAYPSYMETLFLHDQ